MHLLENDDTLEPRDIIVMCPDIDMFAPLVSAAFGQHGAEHPGHRLRVRLADRSLGRTNPLLDTVAGLLRLADGRVTASEVLDLAAKAPVARQFRFTSENLETLRRWAAVAGARWGLFEAQRQQFGMATVRQNTFSTARDRILLGVTSDESDLAWLGVILPLDDVDSTDADLAGRFAEYIDRLGSTLARLTGRTRLRCGRHCWNRRWTGSLTSLAPTRGSVPKPAANWPRRPGMPAMSGCGWPT